MKRQDTHSQDLLDRAVAEVRDDRADAATEQAAAQRVWERLSRELGTETGPQPVASPEGPIRSCDDYQALIPAYLAGQLPPARALLLEDHTRECVPCRKALKAAQRDAGEDRRRVQSTHPGRRGTGATPWRTWLPIAAALAVGLGLTWALFLGGLFGGGEVAQVRVVEGQLFRLDGAGAEPLLPGQAVSTGEELRTAKGSGAVVRLDDGSTIEMRERSEITLARRLGETTIRVARGSIIVEAAEQRGGHLYVATDDCLVSVRGTIFSVDHGTKGSRVAVIEGEVKVEHGRKEAVLHPGQQIATHAALGALPLEKEIAWSRDSDRYLALLQEIKALDEELHRALAAPELRYTSRLLQLAPAETSFYFAMPNVVDQVAEMHRIIEERLATSEVLGQWWREKVGESGLDEEIEEMVTRISELGQHLGEEIALTLALDEKGEPSSPLLLAEVASPAAFAAVLAEEVERLNSASGEPHLVIVTDPGAIPAAGDHQVLLWLAGDVFAAAIEPQALQRLAATIEGGANPFTGTTFYARLAEVYTHGAQWVGGVDLGRLLAGEIAGDDEGALDFTGLADVDTLIFERKSDEELTHTGAVLSFTGPRRGAAAWLAEPAAMGTLDFVSADASFAAAFVVEEPVKILDEIFRFVESTETGFRDELARFESEYGVSVREDLAAPLGGEIAFALDGPALPRPAWKVVAEVYDPARLAQTLEWAVEQVNQAAVARGEEPPLVLDSQDTGERTVYRVQVAKVGMEVYYTFEDGYFLAAPSRTLLDRAIQVRSSRYSLVDAPEFQALVPRDGYLNFSAVVYRNLGSLGDTLKSAFEGAELTAEQRQALESFDLSAPALTCAYGERDRIRIVATGHGGLLSSRLGTLLGLGALSDLAP